MTTTKSAKKTFARVSWESVRTVKKAVYGFVGVVAMCRKLYHVDAYGFPVLALELKYGVKDLTFSRHAIQAAQNDRYGGIQLGKLGYLDLSKCTLIEVETVDNVIEKIVYRVRYDEQRDVVLAILVADWYVKTVWINLTSDMHKTLDKAPYSRP